MNLTELVTDPLAWYQGHELLIGQIGVNALVALSVWVTLYAGQLTLANVGFMAIGAYTAVIMSNELQTTLVVNALGGCTLAVAAAVAVGLPVLRLRGVFLAIATIGFAEVLRFGVILNLPITGQGSGLANPIADPSGGILPIWLLVAFLVVAFSRLRHSKPMEAWAAIREDEFAAASGGIDVRAYKLAAFALGAFIAALAGALEANLSFFIDPNQYSFTRVVTVLIMVFVGGSLLASGPLLGAAVLTVLPELFRFAADYRQVLYGMTFMVIIVFRPRGLLRPRIGTSRSRLWPIRRGSRPARAAEGA